jgi:hypothetical protein
MSFNRRLFYLFEKNKLVAAQCALRVLLFYFHLLIISTLDHTFLSQPLGFSDQLFWNLFVFSPSLYYTLAWFSGSKFFMSDPCHFKFKIFIFGIIVVRKVYDSGGMLDGLFNGDVGQR